MKVDSVDSWFELDDSQLSVWEDVCAVQSSSTSVDLYKFISDNLYSMNVDCGTEIKLTSTGYWECAEVKGELENSSRFLHHARSPGSAARMLELLLQSSGSEIVRLSIRFDPDPLRLNDQKWIVNRIISFKNVLTSFSPDGCLILDDDMPIS